MPENPAAQSSVQVKRTLQCQFEGLLQHFLLCRLVNINMQTWMAQHLEAGPCGSSIAGQKSPQTVFVIIFLLLLYYYNVIISFAQGIYTETAISAIS